MTPKYVDGEPVEDKMHNPLGDMDDVERQVADNLKENLEYSESDSDDEYNPATEKYVIFYCSFYSDASSMDSTNDEICNQKFERIRNSESRTNANAKEKVHGKGKNAAKEIVQ